jgi:hypothetical protein
MVTAALGSLALLMSSIFLWLNTIEFGQEKNQVIHQRNLLEQFYEVNFTPIQQQLDDVDSVQAAVMLAQRLQREQMFSPETLFPSLSSVFNQTKFSDIELDLFSWKKYTKTELTQLLNDQLASVNEVKHSQEEYYDEGQEEAEEGEENQSLQPLLILEGNLRRGDRNYRQTVAIMNDFAKALSQLPQVTQVIVLRLPVDVRPALTFSDDVGSADLITRNKVENNQYQILIGLTREQERNE